MSQLIEHLKSFNRKERFILLEKVLRRNTFRLSDNFRKELSDCLELGFEIPDCAYVAMDYHIDWIKMAVYLAKNPESKGTVIRSEKGIEGINENQQDVDLLVAFTRGSATHLVLIEAKADTSWNYKQLRDKCNELKESISPTATTLELHLVLMSPKLPHVEKSKYINISEWPCWMKKEDGSFNFMQLDLPQGLRKITRCDGERNDDENGEYYKIDP